ncbi:MAG: hypothetical protein ACYCXQ_01475 [Candidatus Humimicrobiaceae bacterium]
MFLVIEIILIALIATGAVIYFIWHLRKELKGNCSCGNVCDSCKIKENCNEPKSFDKTIKKSKRAR